MSERILTRRRVLSALLAAPAIYGQGVASRRVRATPRSKPSGLPFGSKLTDISASAGLKAPAICGGIARKDYLIEVMGCGVAFFDYDNDGWMDLFVLSGARLDGSEPDATNRLYHNNREWHLHRCDGQSRPGATWLGHGRHRRRLQQRRIRGSVHYVLGTKCSIPKQR